MGIAKPVGASQFLLESRVTATAFECAERRTFTALLGEAQRATRSNMAVPAAVAQESAIQDRGAKHVVPSDQSPGMAAAKAATDEELLSKAGVVHLRVEKSRYRAVDRLLSSPADRAASFVECLDEFVVLHIFVKSPTTRAAGLLHPGLACGCRGENSSSSTSNSSSEVRVCLGGEKNRCATKVGIIADRITAVTSTEN